MKLAKFYGLLLLFVVAACVNQVTVPKTPAEAINEANITLTATANVIAQNVKDKIYTPEQAQSYLDKVKDLRKRVDQARELVDKGMPDAAQQADLLRSLVLTLHREVAARAR